MRKRNHTTRRDDKGTTREDNDYDCDDVVDDDGLCQKLVCFFLLSSPPPTSPRPSLPLSLPYPAGFPDEFPWSEAARDLRVSWRLLAGTQRLNFRCNRLTAITFRRFGRESLPIKYLRVARPAPPPLPTDSGTPMPLYPMENHIMYALFFPRFCTS